MEFTLHIKCDSAAFEDNPGREIARILRNAARRAENGEDFGQLLDANGNVVGEMELKDEQCICPSRAPSWARLQQAYRLTARPDAGVPTRGNTYEQERTSAAAGSQQRRLRH